MATSKVEASSQDGIMVLAQANNYLSVHFHRLLSAEKENVFFSPFSISCAMAMLLCAAEGATASELRSVLGYDHAGLSGEDVATLFEKQLSALLENPKGYTLSSVNSMLSQEGFEIKDGYKRILAKSFKALLIEADFLKEGERVVNQVNEWVKERTNGMIPNMLNSLDSSTVMVLLNAVYFMGTWLEPFEKELTYPEKFFNKGKKDNAKVVDMMHMKTFFLIHEDRTLQALQLPYVGEEIAMLILLPRSKNGLESVEAKLSPSFIQTLKTKLQGKKVKITLPRFKLEYTKSLVPCFQKLGVKKIFKEGAELGAASDYYNLAVSEISHKAVLEVNEEGSEAAAATEPMVYTTALVVDPEFRADHPFAFVIYDTKTDLILFMGRVIEL